MAFSFTKSTDRSILKKLDGWDIRTSRMYIYISDKFPGMDLSTTVSLYLLLVKSCGIPNDRNAVKFSNMRFKILDEWQSVVIPFLENTESHGIICVDPEIDPELSKYSYFLKFAGDPMFYLLSSSGGYTISPTDPREDLAQSIQIFKQGLSSFYFSSQIGPE